MTNETNPAAAILRDQVATAAEMWANAEYAEAKILCAGGSGNGELCAVSEDKFRTLLDELAALVTTAPVAAIQPAGVAMKLEYQTVIGEDGYATITSKLVPCATLAVHARNCSGYDQMQECTCGAVFKQRISDLESQLGTEQSMHKAWRKRAEEAEAAIAQPSDADTFGDVAHDYKCVSGDVAYKDGYRAGLAAAPQPPASAKSLRDIVFDGPDDPHDPHAPQPPASTVHVGESIGNDVEYPSGAIYNGQAFIDRLEQVYDFNCEAGPLRNCYEWMELRRCFDYLAAYIDARSAASAKDAGHDVLAERQRQMSVEGWTPAHDDKYQGNELRLAAFCYLRAECFTSGVLPAAWPWATGWWKPTDDRRNLIKACALILAEIERLDRAAIATTKAAK